MQAPSMRDRSRRRRSRGRDEGSGRGPSRKAAPHTPWWLSAAYSRRSAVADIGTAMWMRGSMSHTRSTTTQMTAVKAKAPWFEVGDYIYIGLIKDILKTDMSNIKILRSAASGLTSRLRASPLSVGHRCSIFPSGARRSAPIERWGTQPAETPRPCRRHRATQEPEPGLPWASCSALGDP